MIHLDNIGQQVEQLLEFGSDLNNKPTLNAKAKRKLVTRTTLLALIDIAREKEDKEAFNPQALEDFQ